MPVSDWLDMMPDTLTCQPGTENQWGTFTASGEALTPRCRIESEVMLVNDPDGNEIASNVQVYVALASGLTINAHRYTLPAEFDDPRENLKAISIGKERDEDGAHHQVVYLKP